MCLLVGGTKLSQWSDDAPTCDIKGKAWYHLQEDSSIQLYDRVHTQRIIQFEHVGKLDSGVMMHQHVTLKVRLGTTYKKTAVYSCMTGFTLKGSYRRTCGQTGQWSDDAPTCDIKGKAWYHLQEDSSIQLYDRVHTQRIIQENMWANWTVE